MEVRVLFEGENRIAVEPKFKKKGAHESGKGPQSDIQGLGGEGDKNCNN